MTLSMLSVARSIVAALCALMLVGSLGSSLASANGLGSDSTFASASTRSADAALLAANADVALCSDADPSDGDHHEKKSWSEMAKEWEKGARKHAKDGNHASAASAYEMAACYWELDSEFEKAKAATEKAAEQRRLAAKGR